jgi:hypothetical protein
MKYKATSEKQYSVGCLTVESVLCGLTFLLISMLYIDFHCLNSRQQFSNTKIKSKPNVQLFNSIKPGQERRSENETPAALLPP